MLRAEYQVVIKSVLLSFFVLDHRFYFLAQLVGGFTLSDFWTSRGHRCRPFSPPRYVNSFLSRIGFSIPTARRLSSNVADSRSRASR